MNKVILLFIVILIGMSWRTTGQGDLLQRELMQVDQTNIDEVMAVVADHFDEVKKGNRYFGESRKMKHWVRWAHYMSARTDQHGKLIDVNRKMRETTKGIFPKSADRSSTGNWYFIGPSEIQSGSHVGMGRVDRIAFHPTNPNTFYIGTPAGGLFKTTDGGANWTNMTGNLLSNSVSGIVVDHADPNKIYILTGDGDSNFGGFVNNVGYLRSSAGAFYSPDGGITWNELGELSTAESYVGYQLIQDPNNANILYAATSDGIYKTTNAGLGWAQVHGNYIYDIALKPGSSTIVYAVERVTISDVHYYRLIRSTDAGASWSIEKALPRSRAALAVTPQHPEMVYALSGYSNPPNDSCGAGGTFGGIFVSRDNGDSFDLLFDSKDLVGSCCDGLGGRHQSPYDLALAVSPIDTNQILTGAIRMWKSDNSGSSFSNIQCGSIIHADIHDLEFNPLNNKLYACTDGGVSTSSDNGQTWTDLSKGITATQIYHMDGSKVSLNKMMIGLQDNGFRSKSSTSTVWDNTGSADGFDVAYHPTIDENGFRTYNQDVQRFSVNGSSREGITPPGVKQWFGQVAVNQNNVLLVGYTDIYRSTDNGDNYSNRGSNGNWDIEFAPSEPLRVYAAGGESSFSNLNMLLTRSDDAGLNWINIGNNSTLPDSIRLTDIDVHPTNPDTFWITFGAFDQTAKVFMSPDAGISYINKTFDLPNVPVNSIAVGSNNQVFIGTDIGVYYMEDGGSSWLPYWNNLPIVPVSDLVYYESDNKIRAATFGRGVWESTLPTPCATNYGVTSDISGHKFIEASNDITASAEILGGANSNISLKAGNNVILQPGFKANKHVYFRAYIAPCGSN